MGRRPVREKKENVEAVRTDDASENNTNESSQGAATPNSQDPVTPPQVETAVTTVVAAGSKPRDEAEATEQDGRNPLMGLVYYGSDSDEEGSSDRDGSSPTGSAAKTNEDRGVGLAFKTNEDRDAAEAAGSPVSSAAADATEDAVLNLPSGWQQCMDSSGAIYFWNVDSGETTWEMPAGAIYRRKESLAPDSSALSSSGDAAGTPKQVATGAAERDRVASDATSDTASEPDEGEDEDGGVKRSADIAPATLVSSATAENDKGDPDGEVSRSVENTPLSSAAELDRTGGKSRSRKVGDGDQGANEERSVADDVAQAAAGLSCVDDLLAGIEAEMLSGTGDGGGNRGAGDADKGDKDPTEEIDSAKEDFSPLRAISSGLDVRAQQSYAELVASFAAAEGEGGDVGRQADGMDVKRRLALELGAVLRARLSDWREGGLDGAFLVRKLEEMAVQARSSLLYDRATTESTQTDDVPPAVDVSSDGACIAASAAVDSSKSFGGVAPPSEAGDNMPVDQERATLQKAAPKRNKSKEKSKKGRRLGSGLIQSNSVINGKKKDNEVKAASENREGGSEGNEDSCHAPVDAASKNGSTVAPGAKTTEALREAETIEKLRWADEVSAAAAAAVAAAAREKKEAEARERAVSAAAAAAVAAAAREKKEAEARERAAVDGQASSPPRQQGDGDGHQDEMVPSVGDESREEGEIVVLPKAPDISEPVGRASEGEVSVSLSQNDAKEKNNDGDRTVGARPIGAPSAKHVVASEAGMAPVVNSLLPSGWAVVWDDLHGANYYHNLATNETTWVLPSTRATEAPRASPAEEDPPAPSPPSPNGVKIPTGSVSRETSPEGGKGERREEKKTSKSSKRRQKMSGGQTGDEQAGDSSPTRGRGDMKKTTTLEQEISTEGNGSSAASTKASPTDKISIGEKEKAASAEPGARRAAEELPRYGPVTSFPSAPAGSDWLSGGVSQGRGPDREFAMQEAQSISGSVTRREPGRSSDGPTVSEPVNPRTPSWFGWRESPWAAVWDKIQNAYYYHNTETNETTWVRPSASAVEEKRVVEDGVTPKISQEKNPTQDENIENVSHTALDSDPASQAPSASASGAVDMRPSTLVWWSDAGDVWNGESLSGLLLGYGPRRYRNLGGGYYMITLDSGPEWAAAAVAALGQGVADPVAEARVDWICCTASAPGYGLFLRWAGDDDEQKLFDVPDELFDDPPPDPAVAVAVAVDGDTASHTIASAEAEAAREEAEAAREEEEANAAAAAAVAATEAAEAAGSEAAAKAVAKVPASASLPKKRKTNKGSGTGTSSVGSISKKRKGAASLIDKWKAVASTAGEEAEREAERQEKMERWKARAAALDPDNPNFMPLGRKRR